MNGKKAKAIRRLFKEQLFDEKGNYVAKPDLRVGKETKKRIHTLDQTGKPQLHEVKRVTVINATKYRYRLAKKAYKNGEFTI